MSKQDTQSETSTRTTQKSGTSVGVNVTTKTEVTPIGEGLELNPEHFKTVPGILKLLQLVSEVLFWFFGKPFLPRQGLVTFFVFSGFSAFHFHGSSL